METPNPLFAFLNGKRYTLHGIEGYFSHMVWTAKYPYIHRRERLVHSASKKGKQTAAYKAVQTELGDDWDTDLTEAIESYVAIAYELGYEEPN